MNQVNPAEKAFNILTGDNTKRAVGILSNVPLAKLCKINGLGNIVYNFEISCLMEYISDNYNFNSEDKIKKAAEKVKNYMNKYNCSEEDAIYEVLGESQGGV